MCSYIYEFWLVLTCFRHRPCHKGDVTYLWNLCQRRKSRGKKLWHKFINKHTLSYRKMQNLYFVRLHSIYIKYLLIALLVLINVPYNLWRYEKMVSITVFYRSLFLPRKFSESFKTVILDELWEPLLLNCTTYKHASCQHPSKVRLDEILKILANRFYLTTKIS